MAAFPPYVGLPGRVWYYGLRLVCGVILLFLLLPVLVIMPLSFNSEPYFTYPMPGLSVRWYREFLTSDVWLLALKNSLIVGGCATLSATALGTLAALGLSRPGLRYETAIMGLLISPMVVPLVITAVGMYFLYAPLGLSNSLLGLIVAHTALGTPFVVITVTATLAGFDHSMMRAASSLGASPVYAFVRVTMPLVLPGIVSGALFAFATSFDEVVVVLFLAGVEERTIPRQMWSGVREQLSLTILAVATMLVVLSVALLATLEWLRRRNERLRGLRL